MKQVNEEVKSRKLKLLDVANRVSALRGNVDSAVSARRNIYARLNQTSLKLNGIDKKLLDLITVVQNSQGAYQGTENELKTKASTLMNLDRHGVSGSNGEATYRAAAKAKEATHLAAAKTNNEVKISAVAKPKDRLVNGLPVTLQCNKSCPAYTMTNSINRAKLITGSFEGPNYYSNITGNADRQGLSFGFLQFNFGQGTLQPILQKMYKENPKELEKIFGDNYSELKKVLSMSKEDQIKWADGISTKGKEGLVEPWQSMFTELGKNAHCQSYQEEAAKEYVNRAKSLAKSYGITTDRGLALMFDIAVQSWSIRDPKNLIKDAIKKGTSEKDLLALIAKVSAGSDKDKLARRTAIVTGKGNVHSTSFDLDGDYKLTDKPIN